MPVISKWRAKAKTLKESSKKLAGLQKMADEHKGEVWECNVCHQPIPAEEYVKHNFQCQMSDKLGRFNR